MCILPKEGYPNGLRQFWAYCKIGLVKSIELGPYASPRRTVLWFFNEASMSESEALYPSMPAIQDGKMASRKKLAALLGFDFSVLEGFTAMASPLIARRILAIELVTDLLHS